MSGLTFKEKRRHYFDFELLFAVLKWVFQIAIVCFVAFVLVWYFGQRVKTIGDSMSPTLQENDVTLVNRLAYNMGTPKRDDIIAFHPNGNEEAYCYVRRVIGLPGETVKIKDGILYINDKEKEKIEDEGMMEEAITLGGDEYFVLCDNKESTDDSRSWEIGTVKRSEIEGKVWFVISPFSQFGFVK